MGVDMYDNFLFVFLFLLVIEYEVYLFYILSTH